MSLEIIKRIKKAFNLGSKADDSVKNLQSNFNDEDSKQQSMKDSQGKSDFSGSGYNGPGNVDREKTNSNMGQRNF